MSKSIYPIKMCVVTTVGFTMRVFLLDQLVYLARNGFDVTIICDYDSDLLQNCPSELKYQPIAIDRRASVFSTLISFWDVLTYLKRSDFAIIQYCTPKAALISALAAWLASIRVRLYCQWGIRYVGMNGIRRFIFKMVEKLTCGCSSHISPDSFGNLEFSIAEGLYGRDKASVVHRGSANGVNVNRFDSSQGRLWRAKIRQRLTINGDDFVFGWIGRVNRDKGVNELIMAFLDVFKGDATVQLIMVGPMEGAGVTPQVLETIQSHPRIHYVGLQDCPESYYAAMDVLVVPSYREGFGSFALEAQAMGVPVISTDIPGPREAIIHGKTGLLVPVQDTGSLIQAMMELRNNPRKREAMAMAGQIFVKENFEQNYFWGKVLEHRLNLIKTTPTVR